MKTGSLLIILLSTFIRDVSAQVNLTNTGILKISSGTDILFINGDFTNNSTSSLTNKGSLYVKQNLTNNQSSMAVGTGTLILNGTAVQTVGGTQTFNTYKLQTNNAAGITLNNDLSVSNVHTYSAGLITTSSTPNYLIYQANATYTGDDNSKHVNGWVEKLGSTSFIFPVGDNTYERTVAVNTSTSSEFNVKYATSTPNTSLIQLQPPLISIDPNEYWIINQVSGSSATVGMNWDNTKVAFPPWTLSNIVAISFNGTQWVDNGGSAAGNVTTQGNITSNSVSSFTMFTFGSITVPLSLKLVSFTAKYVTDHTALSWTTDDEQNLDHFVVERSDNGVSFYPVVQAAARNSGQEEIYNARDDRPINRVAYYRLRSIDRDGREELSGVEMVTIASGNNTLALLTNPVHDKVTLAAGENLNGTFDYIISSFNGQLIQKGQLQITNGATVDLPLSKNVNHGMYTLQVINRAQAFHFSFVAL